VPVLRDLAVLDPEDVDLADRVRLAARRQTHELADLNGMRSEPDTDPVPLPDMSSIVMLTSDNPAETRSIARFRSALPAPWTRLYAA
jgi:hypothetical protein